ncbi:MAG: ABC transporter substrate-binding protein [Desulfobacterota bacterium]|nr:ABC transporter substrate-binding protein [Thermodesulfobacteriota bacterium]
MHLHTLLFWCGWVASLVGTLVGCSSGKQTSQELLSVLRIGVGRDLYDGPDSRSYVHGSLNAWEALTYLDERLQAKEWLADSWVKENGGKRWVFRLKDNVSFHDGTSLTKEAVIENILRYRDHPKYDPHGLYRDLRAVDGIGERGVVFLLDKPYPNFPATINYFGSAIFGPNSFDSKGQFVKFTGTGPYRFETNRDGVIRLKAHSTYWQGRPPFDTVEFWFIPDAATRLNALKRGEVDAIVDVGGILPGQLPEIKSSKQVRLKKRTVATTHYLLFNAERPPFQMVSLRKWLVSTLDRERLVRSIVGEAGVVSESLFTPLAEEWHEKAFPLIPPVESRPSPQYSGELIILLHAGALQRWPYKDLAEAIHASLLRGGLKPKIRIEEAGLFKESLKRGDFDLALHPFTLMTGDPDIFFTWMGNVSPWAFGKELKKVAELLSRARHETHRDERKKMYRQLQRWVAENYLLLPLYHDVAFYAHRESIDGLEIDAFFRPDLMKVKRVRDGR